jgi:hypothetical protein
VILPIGKMIAIYRIGKISPYFINLLSGAEQLPIGPIFSVLNKRTSKSLKKHVMGMFQALPGFETMAFEASVSEEKPSGPIVFSILFLHPASKELLFDVAPEHLWQHVLRDMGSKYASLSMIPENLTIN